MIYSWLENFLEFKKADFFKYFVSTKKAICPLKHRVKNCSIFSAKFRAVNFNFFNISLYILVEYLLGNYISILFKIVYILNITIEINKSYF